LLLIADKERPQLIAEVREQLSKLRYVIDQHDEFVWRETWRLDCDNASRVMLETVEQLLDKPTPALATDLQALLTVAGPSLLDAFDYARNEEYSFSIFQRVDAKAAMVRIAQNWSVPEDAAKDQRTWKKGQGFTGQCWQSNQVIAVPDANDAVARQVYAMKPEDYPADWPKELKTDAERYQSFVCVPIKVGISQEPWGILTITSNVKGRFDTVDQDNAGAANIPLAKLVAALLALIVAANTKN
jgi:transcriptional regulator with GAF, ATPase, and Fis domain